MPTVDMHFDMRARLPIVFGDERSESIYACEVQALRARLAPGRFAVAPRMTVSKTRRGELREGALLCVADLFDDVDVHGRLVATAAARWRRLIESGVVLEGGC